MLFHAKIAVEIGPGQFITKQHGVFIFHLVVPFIAGVTVERVLVMSLVALASQLAVAEVVTLAIALEEIRAAATTPANTIFFILNFLRIIKLVPFMELLLQILIMTLSR